MKRPSTNWLLVLCGASTLVGCGSANGNLPTGSGGSSGSGSGGSSGGSVEEVTLTPDDTGWIDVGADGNSLGVQGSWYPYGDQYGPLCGPSDTPNSASGMKCNDSHFGAHDPSECSVITEPDPTVMSFPNSGGMMCTKGTIAKVIAIVNSSQGTGMDYSNIWGAGIGLDLNAMMGGTACDTKGVFAAKDKHVIGIKFDIDQVPSVGLRVEFPIPATDGTKNGSDYWGGSSSYPNSPVTTGTNTIYFDPASLGMGVTVKGVTPAGMTDMVPFDPNEIESIQFHVPAGTTSAYPAAYQFCISNLKMLVQQ